jgi:hypothetical protein
MVHALRERPCVVVLGAPAVGFVSGRDAAGGLSGVRLGGWRRGMRLVLFFLRGCVGSRWRV